MSQVVLEYYGEVPSFRQGGALVTLTQARLSRALIFLQKPRKNATSRQASKTTSALVSTPELANGAKGKVGDKRACPPLVSEFWIEG